MAMDKASMYEYLASTELFQHAPWDPQHLPTYEEVVKVISDHANRNGSKQDESKRLISSHSKSYEHNNSISQHQAPGTPMRVEITSHRKESPLDRMTKPPSAHDPVDSVHPIFGVYEDQAVLLEHLDQQEIALRKQTAAVNEMLARLDTAFSTEPKRKDKPIDLIFKYAQQVDMVDTIVHGAGLGTGITSTKSIDELKSELEALKRNREHRRRDLTAIWAQADALVLAFHNQSIKAAREESIRVAAREMLLRKNGWAFLRKLYLQSRLSSDRKKVIAWYQQKISKKQFNKWSFQTQKEIKRKVISYLGFLRCRWHMVTQKFYGKRRQRDSLSRADCCYKILLLRVRGQSAFQRLRYYAANQFYLYTISVQHFYRVAGRVVFQRFRELVRTKAASTITMALARKKRLVSGFEALKQWSDDARRNSILCIQIDDRNNTRQLRQAILNWMWRTKPVARRHQRRAIKIAGIRIRRKRLVNCFKFFRERSLDKLALAQGIVHYTLSASKRALRLWEDFAGNRLQNLGSLSERKNRLLGAIKKSFQKLLRRTITVLVFNRSDSVYFKTRQLIRLNSLRKHRAVEIRETFAKLRRIVASKNSFIQGREKWLMKSWRKVCKRIEDFVSFREQSRRKSKLGRKSWIANELHRAFELLRRNSDQKKRNMVLLRMGQQYQMRRTVKRIKQHCTAVSTRRNHLIEIFARKFAFSVKIRERLQLTQKSGSAKSIRNKIQQRLLLMRMKSILHTRWIPYLQRHFKWVQSLQIANRYYLNRCKRMLLRALKANRNRSSQDKYVIGRNHCIRRRLVFAWKVWFSRSGISYSTNKGHMLKKGISYFPNRQSSLALQNWRTWSDWRRYYYHLREKANQGQIRWYLRKWRKAIRARRRRGNRAEVQRKIKNHTINRLAQVHCRESLIRFGVNARMRALQWRMATVAEQRLCMLVFKRLAIIVRRENTKSHYRGRQYFSIKTKSLALTNWRTFSQLHLRIKRKFQHTSREMSISAKHLCLHRWSSFVRVAIGSRFRETNLSDNHLRCHRLFKTFHWWITLCTNKNYLRSHRKHAHIGNSEARSRGFFRRWKKKVIQTRENQEELVILDSWRRQQLVQHAYQIWTDRIVDRNHTDFLVTAARARLNRIHLKRGVLSLKVNVWNRLYRSWSDQASPRAVYQLRTALHAWSRYLFKKLSDKRRVAAAVSNQCKELVVVHFGVWSARHRFRRQRKRAVAIAKSKFERCKLPPAVRIWHRRTSALHEMKLFVSTATKLSLLKGWSFFLVRYRQFARNRALYHHLSLQAYAFRRNSVLSRCFKSWRDACSEGLSKLARGQLCVQFLRTKRGLHLLEYHMNKHRKIRYSVGFRQAHEFSHGWSRFHQMLEFKKHAKVQCLKFTHYFGTRKQFVAIQQWRTYSESRRGIIESSGGNVAKKMAKAILYQREYVLSNAWTKMINRFQTRKEVNWKFMKTLLVLEQSHYSRVVDQWYHYVNSRRLAFHNLTKAALHCEQLLQKNAIDKFLEMNQKRKSILRGVLHNCQHLLRSAFVKLVESIRPRYRSSRYGPRYSTAEVRRIFSKSSRWINPPILGQSQDQDNVYFRRVRSSRDIVVPIWYASNLGFQSFSEGTWGASKQYGLLHAINLHRGFVLLKQSINKWKQRQQQSSQRDIKFLGALRKLFLLKLSTWSSRIVRCRQLRQKENLATTLLEKFRLRKSLQFLHHLSRLRANFQRLQSKLVGKCTGIWLSWWRRRVLARNCLEALLRNVVRRNIKSAFLVWSRWSRIEGILRSKDDKYRKLFLKNAASKWEDRVMSSLFYKNLLKIALKKFGRSAISRGLHSCIIFSENRLAFALMMSKAANHHLDFKRKEALNNMLFARQRRLAEHHDVVRKCKRSIRRLLKYIPLHRMYQTMLMKAYHRRLRKAFYCIRRKLLLKKKHQLLNGTHYVTENKRLTAVEKWNQEQSAWRAYLMFRKLIRHRLANREVIDRCDRYHDNEKCIVSMKCLLTNRYRRRKERYWLQSIDRAKCADKVKRFFHKLDVHCAFKWAQQQKYELVEQHAKRSCLLRGLRAFVAGTRSRARISRNK